MRQEGTETTKRWGDWCSLYNWNQAAACWNKLKYTTRNHTCHHTKDHHMLKWNLDGIRSQHSQPANTLYQGWQGWKQNCAVRLRLHVKTDMYWNDLKWSEMYLHVSWIFFNISHLWYASLILTPHLFESRASPPVAVAFRKLVSASGAGGRPWPWHKPA